MLSRHTAQMRSHKHWQTLATQIDTGKEEKKTSDRLLITGQLHTPSQGGGREIMAARRGVYAKRLGASSYNGKNQFYGCQERDFETIEK